MNVQIELTYKTPKGLKTMLRSDDMNAETAIIIAEDLIRTGRTKDVLFLDKKDSSWTMKEMKEFLKGIETEPHNITVYFDGGFDIETKRSGLGCAIYYEQNGKSYRLRKNALVEQLETNNESEYAALHLALKELELMDVHHIPIKFIGDSNVVINQLSGEWPCSEEELTKWADRIDSKLKQLGLEPKYELVSRKMNREADQLASQALKDIEIMSTFETN